MKRLFFVIITLFCVGCNKDKEIRRLLNAPKAVDRIKGCYAAMETDDLSYVPLLLEHSGDGTGTTDFRYKGTIVYQADMRSLIKLLKVKPPHPITYLVDSVNVKFFFHYWEEYKKKTGRK